MATFSTFGIPKGESSGPPKGAHSLISETHEHTLFMQALSRFPAAPLFFPRLRLQSFIISSAYLPSSVRLPPRWPQPPSKPFWPPHTCAATLPDDGSLVHHRTNQTPQKINYSSDAAGGSKKIPIPETVVSAESSKRNILRKGRGAGSGKVKAKHGQGVDDGSTYDDVMDPGDPCYDLQEQDDNYILVSGDADQAMLSSSPGQGGGGSSWGSRGSGGGSYGEKGFLGRQAQGSSPPRRSYDPNLQRVVIGPAMVLSEFKRRVTGAIEEYFSSEDIDELQSTITELNCPDYHYDIVKRAISLSLDRAERERELVSKFFSAAYPTLLSTDQIGKVRGCFIRRRRKKIFPPFEPSCLARHAAPQIHSLRPPFRNLPLNQPPKTPTPSFYSCRASSACSSSWTTWRSTPRARPVPWPPSWRAPWWTRCCRRPSSSTPRW